MITPRERAEAVTAASNAACALESFTLRANGKGLSGPDLDAMLARAVARERVEVELDVLAYEQGARDASGHRTHNRNHVRFRDGLLMKLGRTGKGVPFLRDHRQGDSTARAGTVIESWTEKVDDEGHYRVMQTVRLSEPAAVERALRGLMSAVSIGWRPTGPVHCTLCKAEILTECTHFPGDVDGEATAEWEFTEAELIETSEVPVPGVQSAGIEGIRAALSAATNRGASPQETTDMSKLVGIATALGLTATAGEDDISEAAASLVAERNVLRVQLEAEQKRTAEIDARLRTHEALVSKQAEDAWIAEGLRAGKITKGDYEEAMRVYFRSNRDAAVAMLAAAPVITPVGQPQQTAPAVPPSSTAAGAIAQLGVNPAKARHYAKAFGAKDPDKALADYAARLNTEA